MSVDASTVMLARPKGSGMTSALLTGSALCLGASLGADQMLPFYSATFVVGVIATFYYAITFGPRPGSVVATAVMVAFVFQALGAGDEKLQVAALQAPALVLFFLGAACIPRTLASILEAESRQARREGKTLQVKLAELEQTLKDERKERVQDKGSEAKEDIIKITSRTTQLSTFLREVLQAASTKEILNLFFTNTTKSYGNLEVGLFVPSPDGAELIATRISHREHEQLEGQRLAMTDVGILASACGKTSPMLLPERVVIRQDIDFGARILVPVAVPDGCAALLTLGKVRNDHELGTEDAQLLGTFAELAAEGISQLTVVHAS